MTEVLTQGPTKDIDLRVKFAPVLLLPFAVTLLAIFDCIFTHSTLLNYDVALTLQEAQLVLAGKLPYVDFVNIQPPLFYYLFVPVVLCANVLRLPLALLNLLFVSLFILYYLLGSLAVVRKSVEQVDWALMVPVIFSGLIFNLPIFYHFGQKEHIFLLTFFPYFLMRWLRYGGQRFSKSLAFVVGTIAGIGIALKPPSFLLTAAALEGYWYVTSKDALKRMCGLELLSCLGVFPLYVSLFLALSPDSVRTALLTRWMPFLLKGYAAYSQPFDQLLLLQRSWPGGILTFGWMVVLVLVCAGLIYQRSTLIVPLGVWTLVSYVSYVLQATAWPYQTIPMVGAFFILANLELAIIAKWVIGQCSMISNTVAILGGESVCVFMCYSCMLYCCLPLLIQNSLSSSLPNKTLDDVVSRYSCEGDRILVLSAAPTAYPCLLHFNRKPSSRYLFAFPLTMCEFLKRNAKDSRDREQYERIEKIVIGEISEDVVKLHPTQIIMAPSILDSNGTVRMFSCMEMHGFDKVLANYAPLGSWNNHLIWILDHGGSTRNDNSNH